MFGKTTMSSSGMSSRVFRLASLLRLAGFVVTSTIEVPRHSLDAVRRSPYPEGEHVFVNTCFVNTCFVNTCFVNDVRPRRADAHGAPAGDLELPRRVRRRARVPAHGPRDRRARRPGVAVDGARAPREPRAGGAPPARPDEAARPRVARPRARAARAGGGARRARGRAAAPADRRDRRGRPAPRGAEYRGVPPDAALARGPTSCCGSRASR